MRLPAAATALRFEIRTTECDTLRASVDVSGKVGRDAAALLEQVLDDHQRAGRRFVRLDLRTVTSMCREALTVVLRAHEALLRRRGTLVITGVDERVAGMLEAGDPERQLFLLPPTAEQLVLAGSYAAS
jgi:anti-anti-sigma regulatory factor